MLHLDADCVMIKPVDELFEMQVPFMCAASRVLTARLPKLPKLPKPSGRSLKEGPWSRPKPPSPHGIDLRGIGGFFLLQTRPAPPAVAASLLCAALPHFAPRQLRARPVADAEELPAGREPGAGRARQARCAPTPSVP